MTSLDSRGIQLSLMQIDPKNNEWLNLLDAPTSAPAWPHSYSAPQLTSIVTDDSEYCWRGDFQVYPYSFSFFVLVCFCFFFFFFCFNYERFSIHEECWGGGVAGWRFLSQQPKTTATTSTATTTTATTVCVDKSIVN